MSDKNQQAQQEPTQDLGALMKVRRDKMEAFREMEAM